MSRITFVKIIYEEQVDHDYVYANHNHINTMAQLDGGTGVYEMEVTEPDITNSQVAKAYADQVFRDRSECSLSGSYTCYQRGLDLIRTPIKIGMTQDVNVRGYDTSLVIESIRYSLQKGTQVPIFKLDVSLATKPRNMNRVLTKLLRKHR